MSDFEFFFSFYGLLLGLSVAEVAGGIARTVHERKTTKVGWLTPLLAAFVCLDIASFWAMAWQEFRDLRFGYALLVLGMAIAMIYYISASLVFPRKLADWPSLDDHFWANRRMVLGGVLLSNLIVAGFTIWRWTTAPAGTVFPFSLVGLAFFMLVPAAMVVKNRWIVMAVLVTVMATYLSWLPELNPLQARLDAAARGEASPPARTLSPAVSPEQPSPGAAAPATAPPLPRQAEGSPSPRAPPTRSER